MDPTYIAPFIQSVQNVFSTMMQLPVTLGQPSVKQDQKPAHDVSGIIGMSGAMVGSIVLSFPSETAQRVVSLFCGQQLETTDPDFADAIGELVNMVSGGAKALFPAESRASISVPSVIVGKNHTVSRPSGVPCVVLPCECDCGDFVVEIALRHNENENVGTKAAVATA